MAKKIDGFATESSVVVELWQMLGGFSVRAFAADKFEGGDHFPDEQSARQLFDKLKEWQDKSHKIRMYFASQKDA